MAEKEGKHSLKTQVLSMRMDPRTRFWVDIVSRVRGQSISTVLERALQEAADNAPTPDGRTWRDFWHVQEGIRSLEVAKDHYLAAYEDLYRLDFAKTHWQFFYSSSACKSYHEGYIAILWPRIDEFLSLWSKTKSSNYFAAGKAMRQALSDAGVEPPDDWPARSEEAKGPGTGGGYRERAPPPKDDGQKRGGGPSWDAPKGGDLDDEIPF